MNFIIVGLTGGIGSGKTLVSHYFSELGVPVYHSDSIAKELMLSESIRPQVIRIFGNEAYNKQGLNRLLIAQVIFSDKKKRNQLSNLIHPVVYQNFNDWKSELKSQTGKLIIKEAAILFESGSHKQCDYVIVILAKKAIRIQRAMERDGTTKKQILARMSTQWSQKKLKALSDKTIVNNGTPEELRKKVENTFQELNNIIK